MKILALLVTSVIVSLGGAYLYLTYAPAPEESSLKGDLIEGEIAVDDHWRSYLLYRPRDMKPEPPLIIVLHGSRGTSQQVRQSVGFEFDLLADKFGFLVVYPQGFDNHWNDCRASADYEANLMNIDDVLFLRTLKENLEIGLETTIHQVLVTGHSNGGHMAYRMGLEAPDFVSVIAPVSANLPVDENLDCEKSGEPVPTLIFNGTEDPLNPYDGGLVSIFGNDSRGHVISSYDSALYWAGLAESGVDPLVTTLPENDDNPGTSVRVHTWPGNNEVRLYELIGSGHVIPSQRVSFPRLLGGDAGDLSAPTEMVDFLNQQLQ